MTTTDEYLGLCADLHAAGGYAAVRRTAREGLRQDPTSADLHCWLALGHVGEDEDDHDDEAEKAFRAGLELAPDHPGLLAGYAEFCLAADAFEYPGRAARARTLLERLERLAPGSPEAEHAQAALRWSQRSWWEDVRMQAAAAQLEQGSARAQSDDLAYALRDSTAEEARHRAEAWLRGRPEDHRAAVLAATLAELSGPARAPLRLLARHRAPAWAAAAVLAYGTNALLRSLDLAHGLVVWGWAWLLPVFVLDRRLSAARRRAQEQVVARMETRLTPAPAPGD
ncbi:tetratricopeptide repeat protein [Actinacidiphila glaucinigra]|uniref:Tetratricopeptide repeat protein n=1 Tax=Actinacidiphila glaucinigra TaxID=235986 RepID=A0A239IA81_9ACTN|nr:hypothetical protein [Actinacidiphila glaucinigra]SNS89274.1 hypothetical protein SAMN05216252_11014 [Actinacidiphila glaucinigra]